MPNTQDLTERPGSMPQVLGRGRLNSIDLLRGLIMVIMALDHTREFFTAGSVSVRDVNHPVLFLTRWITHFCASNFVFLAGVGAFLYMSRPGRSLREGRRFLLTRGVWLVVLELTLIRFGWSFQWWPEIVLLQVIWVIGWSMVLLSGLLVLPRPWLGGLAVLGVVGHNLFDQVQPGAWGHLGWLWSLLHQPTQFQITPQIRILELYPLIPWAAVLTAGYSFGPVFTWESARRRRVLLRSGTLLLLLFVGLRASRFYGDPAPWTPKETFLASTLSFLDCQKYPPSLLFLAMTLGPGLLGLAAWDTARGKVAQFFITFGRVPFFYYLAHIYLIHSLAVIWALLQRRNPSWLFQGLPPMNNPRDWDLSLPAVYGIWLLVVLILFPPCRWFGQVKRNGRAWWLSYV